MKGERIKMNKVNNEPDICNGCKREFSTDIKEHMQYCMHCVRGINDPDGATGDYYERTK